MSEAWPALRVAAVVCIAALAACADDGAPAPRGAGTEAREGYVEGAGGARLYYRVVGDAPDTVVVVHGGPGAGMGSVLPDFAPLAQDFTLVFYDQRGGGRSTLPADTSLLHAHHFTEDLEAVRRHFSLDRMKVLAHSFGSVLVARYALRYPDRLERVVFHGATGPEHAQAVRIARASPPPADSALARRASSLLGALLTGEAEDPVAACRKYEEIQRTLARMGGDRPAWKGSTCDAPPEAVGYYYRHTARLAPRSYAPWDFTTGLGELAAPLLVVHGDRDSLALAAQRSWAASVREGRLLGVPGVGKGAVAERPEVVLPAITRFLRGRWPAAAEPVAGDR